MTMIHHSATGRGPYFVFSIHYSFVPSSLIYHHVQEWWQPHCLQQGEGREDFGTTRMWCNHSIQAWVLQHLASQDHPLRRETHLHQWCGYCLGLFWVATFSHQLSILGNAGSLSSFSRVALGSMTGTMFLHLIFKVWCMVSHVAIGNPSWNARVGLLRPNMRVAIRHPHGPLTTSRVAAATWLGKLNSCVFPSINILSYLTQGLEEDHWQRLQLEKVLQCNLAFINDRKPSD